MRAVFIEITATRGSTPRETGTVMRVTPDGFQGSIGGGALEYEAIATARDMLDKGMPDQTRTYPLGPNLGQCCGGTVTLLFSYTPRALRGADFIAAHPIWDGPSRPLWVWGAGHVGRALVERGHPTHAFDITWIDSNADRFPNLVPDDVTRLPVTNMPAVVPYAPKNASHLIVTYSHDIDLALCAAILRHGAHFCGLIGSATKWARFSKRLGALGLNPAPITCPIGDPALGKHPNSIASGTIAALLAQQGPKGI